MSELETSEEMRELTVGKTKTKAKGWRVSDTARVGLDGKAVSGAKALKVKLVLQEQQNRAAVYALARCK